MDQSKAEVVEDVKNVLARVEGTLNILNNGHYVLAHRKLQGIRDKLRHVLLKCDKLSGTMSYEDKQMVFEYKEETVESN
jgi:hypothetical protein